MAGCLDGWLHGGLADSWPAGRLAEWQASLLARRLAGELADLLAGICIDLGGIDTIILISNGYDYIRTDWIVDEWIGMHSAGYEWILYGPNEFHNTF